MATLTDTLTDGVGVARTDTPKLIYKTGDFTDAFLVVDDSRATPIKDTLTDAVGISPNNAAITGRAAVLTETVGLASNAIVQLGKIVLERVGIAGTPAPTFLYGLLAIEGVSLHAAPGVGWPVALADTIGTHAAVATAQSVQLIEELGLAPVFAPSLVYGWTLADTIRVADTLRRFFGGVISEGLDITHAMAGVKLAPATITAGLGIAETCTPRFVIRVTAADSIAINDTDALSMLFQPTIAEGIEIGAAYLSPGGGVVTWAMNTRTGAVTQYDNFAFNSFAQMSPGRYVGASSEGLYELLGDDDDGTDIVAQIKSGFMQFAGARFTLLKAAYLGVRGEGDFVLRILTGDDKTYDYAVSTRDMRSTKVHMGKGLRARYFAFELISTGQDFDLESIEFVPLVAERRV